MSEFNPFSGKGINHTTGEYIKADVRRFMVDHCSLQQSLTRRIEGFLATHGINSYDLTVHEHSVKMDQSARLSVFGELVETVTEALNIKTITVDRYTVFCYSGGDENTPPYMVGVILSIPRHVSITYEIYGNRKFREAVSKVFDDTLVNDDSVIIQRVEINPKTGSLVSNTERVTPPGVGGPPDIFYPDLPSPQVLWDNFSASKSCVLLLQGDVGTGKSSYLRDMMHYNGWGDSVYIVDHDAVMNHPELGDFVRTLDEGSVIIFEDADRIIGRRTDGNATMGALLNATAGIIATGVRLIFTTNLPTLKSVDPALLRPGRTYRRLEFKSMTLDRAKRVRAHVGKAPDDLIMERHYSLAEAINYEEISHDLDTKGFGFS